MEVLYRPGENERLQLPFISMANAMLATLSLPDGSPLPDGSRAHRACSDTNGLRQKAQRQHMGLS